MRGEVIYEYQKLNAEDQKAFRRFLWANTVVGAVLLTGLIALPWNARRDQPGDPSQSPTMHTQANLASEPASCVTQPLGPRTETGTGRGAQHSAHAAGSQPRDCPAQPPEFRGQRH